MYKTRIGLLNKDHSVKLDREQQHQYANSWVKRYQESIHELDTNPPVCDYVTSNFTHISGPHWDTGDGWVCTVEYCASEDTYVRRYFRKKQ